ncbi:MAG TPA: hypothetical protein VFD84_12235 [Candidatus Binatia bacterium]|nr:hypothetical protein [Candidatus Binatia bacterium]
MTEGDDSPGEAEASVRDRYYRGVIRRVFYGSESGTLESEATGREYRFKYPHVEIRGPIPKVSGLREGMTVGFDLAWTSRGPRVSVIRVFD